MRLVTGVAGMRYYRLYYLDRFSGHIEHFREFEAEDDGAAIAYAEGCNAGQAMELWNRERRLRQWRTGFPPGA